jgi:hypothetical protein
MPPVDKTFDESLMSINYARAAAADFAAMRAFEPRLAGPFLNKRDFSAAGAGPDRVWPRR